MQTEGLRYEVADGILTLTLDRPDKMNVLDTAMVEKLNAAFDRADADDAVGVIVLTGAGKAFCAGADLSVAGVDTFDAMAHASGPDSPVGADGSVNWSHPKVRDGGGLLTLRMYRCLKPIIAAVNGVAAGIGATMLLPADIRLASSTARFGFVFSRRGLAPESASSFFLPRLVGIQQALEWCYTGRVFPATEALAGGLIKAIYEPDALLPAAYALAREIIDHAAPVSVVLTRHLLWQGLSMADPMAAHRIESRVIFHRGRGADVREGIASFFEKRPPAFPEKVSSHMPEFFPWWEDQGYY